MNHPASLASLKKPLPDVLIAALQALFIDRFSMTQAMREHHGRDESSYDPMLPDAVVFAQTTEEVAEAVLYLTGEEASYVTAETMRVDGGWTAYQLL